MPAAAPLPVRGWCAVHCRFAAALAVGMHAIPAVATEGGSTNKALGVDTVLTGVMPPPGMRLTTYLGYYTADETLDGNGDPRPNISNFHINATAMTLRFQYVYPNAKLFGADIETRLGITLFGDVDVRFDVQTPGGSLHRTGSANGAFPGGLFAPVLLGWHGETVHQITGLEIFFPAREFRPNQLANISSGFWSVAPAYWITWLPNDAGRGQRQLRLPLQFRERHDELQVRAGVQPRLGPGLRDNPGVAGRTQRLFLPADDRRHDQRQRRPRRQSRPRRRDRAVHPVPSVEGFRHRAQVADRNLPVENRASGNRFFLQLSMQLW